MIGWLATPHFWAIVALAAQVYAPVVPAAWGPYVGALQTLATGIILLFLQWQHAGGAFDYEKFVDVMMRKTEPGPLPLPPEPPIPVPIPPAPRPVPSSDRKINAAGLALIKRWEGLVLAAAPDIADVMTIGYGHTAGVFAGQEITVDQAEQYLYDDLAPVEAFLASACGSTDNQFAAMVSLGFNVGLGGLKRSTMLREHKLGNFDTAADAFLLWDKAHVDGNLVVVSGLLNRRKDERLLYLAA